jgi:hypothetical protein
MPQTPGLNTDAAWGPLRTSTVANAAGGEFVAEPIDFPATLADTFSYQEPGAFTVTDINLNVVRQDLKETFTAAHKAKTAYPWVQFIRGTAGGGCQLTEDVRAATIPNNEEVGVVNESAYTFAAGVGLRHFNQGMLFDHTIAHAAGVSAPVTGGIVQVGAVSATQSLKFFLGNLHSPAPTWSGAAMQLESDPILGFTTATLRGTAMTAMGSTAAYELQTVAGPITDTYWRLNITTVPSGLGYPVCCMWIVDNN